MANIKEILAANLRENRRKRGLTQEKLAKALDIQAFELFNPTATKEGALLHLEQSIVINIEKIISDTIKQTVKEAFEDNIKCYEHKK